MFDQQRSTQWRVANDTEGISTATNFWIQIKCMLPVKVYMIALKAAENTKIIKWKLQGNTDVFHEWIDLPFNSQPLEGTTKLFMIDPKLAPEYLLYRIFVEEAEGINPGLSYWQLYTVNYINPDISFWQL